MNTVQKIRVKKEGVNPKTNKPWVCYEVTLSNGLRASGFDRVEVGDSVDVEEDGKFLNYKAAEQVLTRKNGGDEPKIRQDVPMPTIRPGQELPMVDINAARQYLMKIANLDCLCIDAANAVMSKHVNDTGTEIAKTPEFFQARVASYFIEACRAGMLDAIPARPMQSKEETF